ncbi:MAG: DUF3800 domain-containing protein, partial [Candidatus Methanoplasma sp.]|nr:DUF3800 domain-containing protein [Candidatus Methanoplasma sp.]
RIIGLKQKYFPGRDPRTIELHATDIFNHKKAFKDMPLERRLAIFSDVIQIISEIDCAITAVVIRKDRLYSETLDIHAYAMELLFERLCYFFDTTNGINKMQGKDEECGILLIDSVNPKYDNKIRLKTRALFMTGSKYQKNNYLIEDPLFIDSSYRHLSQMVDCIAYCVRRNYRSKIPDQKEQETYRIWLNQIRNKFLSGNGFDKYGIKVFPK